MAALPEALFVAGQADGPVPRQSLTSRLSNGAQKTERKAASSKSDDAPLRSPAKAQTAKRMKGLFGAAMHGLK